LRTAEGEVPTRLMIRVTGSLDEWNRAIRGEAPEKMLERRTFDLSRESEELCPFAKPPAWGLPAFQVVVIPGERQVVVPLAARECCNRQHGGSPPFAPRKAFPGQTLPRPRRSPCRHRPGGPRSQFSGSGRAAPAVPLSREALQGESCPRVFRLSRVVARRSL